MARKPVSREVDEFADLSEDISDALVPTLTDPLFDESVLEGEISMSRNEFGIDIEDAVLDLVEMVEKAVDFMETNLFEDWERAEKFYNGETDVPIVEGRSKASVTVVRDSIRSVKPSAMRVFTQHPEIVVYTATDPLDFMQCAVAEQQSEYANNLFWNSGGYQALSDIVHNSLVKRSGVLKTHRQSKLSEEFYTLSNVGVEDLYQLQQIPDVTIIEATPVEGVTDLFHVEVAYRVDDAENKLEAVDMTHFFVDDEATTPENAKVIGERRKVTVGEAIAMGLDYPDWEELDDYDVGEDTGREEESTRRGAERNGQEERLDPSGHEFLLTEAYARFDLDGTGLPQLYRFWLGGTSYTYIAHDRVDENPYSVANGDPLPNSFFGRSINDILDEDQNIQTAMLRATLDNANMANNRRLAVHDTLVNMADVMSNVVGAPIRFRAPGMIQEIGVQSQLGALLPLLQYMRQASELKAGTTNAAMGLDPDALQSTDKAAVQNTIQLAQGQVELFCRNIAETGLVSAFQKLLRLALRHPPRNRPVPLVARLFDPMANVRVAVGLGTGSIETKIAALQQVIAKQEQVIEKYGVDNPICSINHMMRSVVDLGRLMGIPNMGRYFNSMTEESMAALQQIIQQQAQAQQQEPPSVAIEKAETIRGQALIATKQADNEQKSKELEVKAIGDLTKLLMDDDYKRDALAQQLEIENAKLIGGAVDKAAVLEAQGEAREYDLQKALLTLHGQNAAKYDAMQTAQAPQRAALAPAPSQPQQPKPGPA